MTIAQFMDDTLAVTDYLQARFTQDTIYLLGHSWRSFVALQASPSRLPRDRSLAVAIHSGGAFSAVRETTAWQVR
jgi:alpha/beta superfamily hydrolase